MYCIYNYFKCIHLVVFKSGCLQNRFILVHVLYIHMYNYFKCIHLVVYKSGCLQNRFI